MHEKQLYLSFDFQVEATMMEVDPAFVATELSRVLGIVSESCEESTPSWFWELTVPAIYGSA